MNALEYINDISIDTILSSYKKSIKGYIKKLTKDNKDSIDIFNSVIDSVMNDYKNSNIQKGFDTDTRFKWVLRNLVAKEYAVDLYNSTEDTNVELEDELLVYTVIK